MTRDASAGGRLVLDQPGGNIAIDLFVLNQHLGTMLETAFAGTGVTPAQYAIYSQIGDQVLTPGRLAESLGLPPATVSGHLATLERRGHLTRTRSAADGRSHRLALTSSGREQWRALRTRMRRALRTLDAQLGSEANHAARLTLGTVDAAVLASTTTLRGVTDSS